MDKFIAFLVPLWVGAWLGATLMVARLGPAAGAELQATPAVAQAPVAGGVHVADDRRRFAEALRLYRSGRWSAAYARFAALADRGHVRAARIALSMQRDGPVLYGAPWEATPAQLEAWSIAAR